MLVLTLINTEKLCWLLANTIAGTFMSGKRDFVLFILWLNVVVRSARQMRMGFTQTWNAKASHITVHAWKCDLHGLAYEIECAKRAKNAEKVIDPELGKGHSNLPESIFSVLTKFRAKDTNLHQEHYQASTNLGLLQANMTWCFKNKGPHYTGSLNSIQRWVFQYLTEFKRWYAFLQ